MRPNPRHCIHFFDFWFFSLYRSLDYCPDIVDVIQRPNRKQAISVRSVSHHGEAAIVSRKLYVSFGIAAPFLAICLAALDCAEAANLNARGNEPSWQVEISDKAITF